MEDKKVDKSNETNNTTELFCSCCRPVDFLIMIPQTHF